MPNNETVLTPECEKVVRDLIADGKASPRGVMGLPYAIKKMEALGLTLWDIAPYTRLHPSSTSEELAEITHGKTRVYLIFYPKSDATTFSSLLDHPENALHSEDSWTMPTVHPLREEMMAAGIGVGMSDVLSLAYRFLSGKPMTEMKVRK